MQATVVVVHHHMVAEDMAVAGEVAATGIHLDLADSHLGGRCHYRTRGDSLQACWGRLILHDAILPPGLSARSNRRSSYTFLNSI